MSDFSSVVLVLADFRVVVRWISDVELEISFRLRCFIIIHNSLFFFFFFPAVRRWGIIVGLML